MIGTAFLYIFLKTTAQHWSAPPFCPLFLTLLDSISLYFKLLYLTSLCCNTLLWTVPLWTVLQITGIYLNLCFLCKTALFMLMSMPMLKPQGEKHVHFIKCLIWNWPNFPNIVHAICPAEGERMNCVMATILASPTIGSTLKRNALYCSNLNFSSFHNFFRF